MAAAPVTIPYTAASIGDAPKKEAVEWLQSNGSLAFLKQHKLNGNRDRTAKSRSKPEIIAAFKDLTENNRFGDDASREAERLAEEAAAAEAAAAAPAAVEEGGGAAAAEEGPVERVQDFVRKDVTRKGDKANPIKKGDTVAIHYTGKLEDGTVFDTTWDKKGKKSVPLKFKVGAGRVIKGWDEGLIGSCLNEKATLTIKSEWAYGKKGAGDGKIPPNANLIFDVEIASVVT